jgi:hypothetical protein
VLAQSSTCSIKQRSKLIIKREVSRVTKTAIPRVEALSHVNSAVTAEGTVLCVISICE